MFFAFSCQNDGRARLKASSFPFLKYSNAAVSSRIIDTITLSIALSVSAIGNLLTGTLLLKKNVKARLYPIHEIFASWLLNSIMFASLTLALLAQSWSVFIIPVTFFFLSVARTYFNVALNSYIFSHDQNQAASLASLRQSGSAAAGIVLTFLGALLLMKSDPFFLLLTTSLVTMGIGVIWRLTASVLSQKFVEVQRAIQGFWQGVFRREW